MRTYTILLTCLFLILLTDVGYSQWESANGPNGGSISCFAFADSNLYAGTYGNGVFRSTDKGEHWRQINSGISNRRVSSITAKDSLVYIGARSSGFFRSTNYGESWTKVIPDWYLVIHFSGTLIALQLTILTFLQALMAVCFAQLIMVQIGLNSD
ncbi:MAG: hypothetical protein HYZ34_15170 [Ignavibacteriae bacterium]|nr:hypothetical protein [Ignavibacteriota bacterium]